MVAGEKAANAYAEEHYGHYAGGSPDQPAEEIVVADQGGDPHANEAPVQEPCPDPAVCQGEPNQTTQTDADWV